MLRSRVRDHLASWVPAQSGFAFMSTCSAAPAHTQAHPNMLPRAHRRLAWVQAVEQLCRTAPGCVGALGELEAAGSVGCIAGCTVS